MKKEEKQRKTKKLDLLKEEKVEIIAKRISDILEYTYYPANSLSSPYNNFERRPIYGVSARKLARFLIEVLDL